LREESTPTRSTRAVRRIRWPFWNSGEGRLRAAWRVVITVAVALGLAIALAYLFLPLLGQSWAPTAGALVAFTLVVLTATRLLDRSSWRGLGLAASTGWAVDLVFGLVLGLVLPVGMLALGTMSGIVRIENGPLVADPNIALTILVTTAEFIAVGFYEELLVRGYLLRNVAEGLNIGTEHGAGAALVGWILTSVLFAGGHGGNPHSSIGAVLALIASGLFVGLGRILTGSLAIPIGIHVTWNLTEATLGFPVSGSLESIRVFNLHLAGSPLWTGGRFGPEGGLLGLVAYAAGSLAILAWTRRRKGSLAICGEIATYSRFDDEGRM
jgi:membrane protease YdiL (CAAX protease family)